ncbi:MAG: IclR family transcriptional regulator [Chloroflexota bacterium]
MKNVAFSERNGSDTASTVPSIGRAASILDEVSRAGAPIGISELARRTGLGKSTIHGLATALTASGLLRRHEGTTNLLLGPKLAELGARAGDQILLSTAGAAVQALSATTCETTLFGRVSGERVEILCVSPGTRLLNLSAPVGATIPILAGALGKAFLSSMSGGGARAYLTARPLRKFTDKSIPSIPEMLDQVKEARENGYAVERDEYLPGVVGAAAEMRWRDRTYFLWTVGLSAGYDELGMRRLGLATRDASRALLRQLEVGRTEA